MAEHDITKRNPDNKIDIWEADHKKERRCDQQLRLALDSECLLFHQDSDESIPENDSVKQEIERSQNTNSREQTDVKKEKAPTYSFWHIQKYFKHIDNLEADLNQERRRHEQLKYQFNKSQESVKSISLEHCLLKSKFDSVKQEQERLKNTNGRLQTDVKEARSSKEQLEKDLAKKSDQYNRLSADCKHLRSKLESVEKENASLEEELNNEIARLESEKTSLTVKNDILKRDIKAIKKWKVEAKDDLEEANKKVVTQASIIQKLESKLEKHPEELATLTNKIKRLQEQEGIKRKTIEDLETKVRDLKSRNNTLEAQIRMLSTKEHEEKGKAEDAAKHVAELETRIAKLRDQLGPKDQQTESLNQTVRRLTEDIRRLTAERGLQTNEQEGLRRQIEDLKMQNEAVTRKDEQHRKLIRQASDVSTTELAEVKEKLKISEDANASLKRDIEIFKTEKRTTEEERNVMAETVDKLKQQYADLSVSSTFKDDELARLRTEITALKSSTEAREKALLESHQREMERMRQEYDTRLRSMEKRQAEEREELQTQIETLFRSLHDDKRVKQDTIRAAVQQMAATNAKTNQIMNAAFRAYQAARERQAKF